MENKTQYIIEIKTVPDSEWRPIGWTTGTFSDIHFFESFSQAEEYVDRISKVITVDLGKSFTATIQALGRGLRKGRDKDSVKIYDVCSNLSHSTRHMKKRMRYYKEAKYPYKHKLVKYD